MRVRRKYVFEDMQRPVMYLMTEVQHLCCQTNKSFYLQAEKVSVKAAQAK